MGWSIPSHSCFHSHFHHYLNKVKSGPIDVEEEDFEIFLARTRREYYFIHKNRAEFCQKGKEFYEREEMKKLPWRCTRLLVFTRKTNGAQMPKVIKPITLTIWCSRPTCIPPISDTQWGYLKIKIKKYWNIKLFLKHEGMEMLPFNDNHCQKIERLIMLGDISNWCDEKLD